MTGSGTGPREDPSRALGWLAAVLFVGVTGCALAGRPEALDPDTVERDVAADFEQRRGVALDLDCPGDMPTTSGESYTCDGTTSDGRQIGVSITIDGDSDGSYTWSDFPAPVTPATPAPSPGG